MTGAEEFLEHFGVKGMKWGVKRAATATANGTTKVGNAASNLHTRAVNSRVNQAGLKADQKIRDTAKAVSAKNKELGEKANATAKKIRDKYQGLNDFQKTGLAIGAAATAYGAVKGASIVKEHGELIINTVKALNDVAKTMNAGQTVANAVTSGSRSLPYSKLIKGAYKVTSLR